MSNEDPTTDEFLRSIWDAFASISLVENLRDKFKAQTFWEFFNRLWATGVLLLVVGFGGVILAIALSNYQLTVVDLTNVAWYLAGAAALWVLLSIVESVDSGEDLLMGHSDPVPLAAWMKFIFGIIVTAVIGYNLIWENSSIINGIATSLLAAIITGMWLFGIAWMLGGLSGLFRIYRNGSNRE